MATPWREVVLTDGDEEICAADPDKRALRPLTELRERGTMAGWWACTREEFRAHDDATAVEAGLGREDIDWSGFPT